MIGGSYICPLFNQHFDNLWWGIGATAGNVKRCFAILCRRYPWFISLSLFCCEAVQDHIYSIATHHISSSIDIEPFVNQQVDYVQRHCILTGNVKRCLTAILLLIFFNETISCQLFCQFAYTTKKKPLRLRRCREGVKNIIERLHQGYWYNKLVQQKYYSGFLSCTLPNLPFGSSRELLLLSSSLRLAPFFVLKFSLLYKFISIKI